MCRSESVISATNLRGLPWVIRVIGEIDPSPASCPTAQTMQTTRKQDLTPLWEGRAKKLFPHSPRKQQRFLSKLKMLREICSNG